MNSVVFWLCRQKAPRTWCAAADVGGVILNVRMNEAEGLDVRCSIEKYSLLW